MHFNLGLTGFDYFDSSEPALLDRYWIIATVLRLVLVQRNLDEPTENSHRH